MPTTEQRLAEVVDELATTEAQSTILRDTRNQLLHKLMTRKKDPLSERAAAELGRVGPSYAHRIKTHGGSPPSGPQMDSAKAA